MARHNYYYFLYWKTVSVLFLYEFWAFFLISLRCLCQPQIFQSFLFLFSLYKNCSWLKKKVKKLSRALKAFLLLLLILFVVAALVVFDTHTLSVFDCLSMIDPHPHSHSHPHWSHTVEWVLLLLLVVVAAAAATTTAVVVVVPLELLCKCAIWIWNWNCAFWLN